MAEGEPEHSKHSEAVGVFILWLGALLPLVGREPAEDIEGERSEDEDPEGVNVDISGKGVQKGHEGAAGLGLMYRIEMPKFIQGIVKANAEALEEVMEMSAMTKSDLSSQTSPSIPFQLPGE